ncbi:MAG: MotA/TolQ/ExbB proton channel family protein [Candidatus Eremiobacterota bacterium]
MMALIGLIVGLACLVAALNAESGHLSAFLSLPAFLIVVGGSLGATLIGFGFGELGEALGGLRRATGSGTTRRARAVRVLNRYSMLFRHYGAVRLEKELEKECDPFLRAGLERIVEGTGEDLLREILALHGERELRTLNVWERFFECLGGYAPTFGIVGTVMGLVGVLGKLDQPEHLAMGIAAAFVATFYGILFANLVFLPMAERCRHLARKQADFLDFLTVGLISVCREEPPRLLNERLQAHQGRAPVPERARAEEARVAYLN